MSERSATIPPDLAELDTDEVLAGYRDGRAGDQEPGDNRSLSYWHGWRNGQNDRNNTSDAAQRALAKAMRLAGQIERRRNA